MNKGLFLDRDGVLILDKHYLSDPKDVELTPNISEALKKAQSLGYLLFLFTNQSGISRGYYSWDNVHACNQRMLEMMQLESSIFTDQCIAPEAPGDPIIYRKPSPKFILEMIQKYQLDPKACWMIGDKVSDIDAGLSAGINAHWVATGKPKSEAIETYINNGTIGAYQDLLECINFLDTTFSL